MSELQKEYEALSDRLVDTQLTFIARAGETGKLYGSVTTADLVDKLNEELGTDIERRQIVGGPLRQLGDHKVTVRLSRDYQPQITVTIEQFEEEAPEEEAPEELAAPEAAATDAEMIVKAEVAEAEDEAEFEDADATETVVAAVIVEEELEEEEEEAEPEPEAADAE